MSVSLLIFALHSPLLALYGVKNSVEGSLESIAYNSAVTRMKFITLLYFPVSFMEVGCGVVRGIGKSISSTVISLIGACALRVVWLYTVFRAIPTLESIYVSYPITWIITGSVFLVYILVSLTSYIHLPISNIRI